MRMHSLAVVASVVAVVTAAHATHAAQIDMSKLTCIGFLQADDPGGAFDVDERILCSQGRGDDP